MQRKDIDEAEHADLCAAMADAVTSDGVITVTTGRHPLFGALILVKAAGACVVLGNDVHLVVGRDETLEDDRAVAA